MVRAMTLRHVCVSLAVACLTACSSDDTIVSLNVTATDRVPVVERLHVTFKQGSRSFVHDFAPPTEAGPDEDSPSSIKNGFYERITLPEGWDEANAQVSVEAFQKGGDPFDPALTDETIVKIEPEGVVAAYVKLDIPEPPPPMGGAGGEGAGGAPAEGGAPGSGGAGADAGSGGADTSVGGAAAGAGGAE